MGLSEDCLSELILLRLSLLWLKGSGAKEINKIEVIEKSIEENTDKYEIKVKYPSIQGGEKEVTDKINKIKTIWKLIIF